MVVVDITSSGMPCGMVKYNKHAIYVNFLTYEFRARGILSLVSFTVVVWYLRPTRSLF